MEKPSLLVAPLAEQCIDAILKSNMCNWELPSTLQPKHLLWMCDEVSIHATVWTEAKVHRWLGFIQAGLLANNILNLEEVKERFTRPDECNQSSEVDPDLIDHLDCCDPCNVEIGG